MTISADKFFKKHLTPAQRKRAAKRAKALIAEYRTMQQLRKSRALTQTQLAKLLGKDQVQISQLEKRKDMLLSTLTSYVEAMGGSLKLVVEFDDKKPIFIAGLNRNDVSHP